MPARPTAEDDVRDRCDEPTRRRPMPDLHNPVTTIRPTTIGHDRGGEGPTSVNFRSSLAPFARQTEIVTQSPVAMEDERRPAARIPAQERWDFHRRSWRGGAAVVVPALAGSLGSVRPGMVGAGMRARTAGPRLSPRARATACAHRAPVVVATGASRMRTNHRRRRDIGRRGRTSLHYNGVSEDRPILTIWARTGSDTDSGARSWPTNPFWCFCRFARPSRELAEELRMRPLDRVDLVGRRPSALGGFDSVGDAEFAEDIRDVDAGRLGADEELSCDLAVGPAAGEPFEHVEFSCRERGAGAADLLPRFADEPTPRRARRVRSSIRASSGGAGRAAAICRALSSWSVAALRSPPMAAGVPARAASAQ